MALVAGGGLSHFVGEPRVGDIDEEFDHWFLDQLAEGDLSEILDMPNDELMEAGNGTGEVRAWVALAGAMGGAPGKVLSYDPSTSGSTAWGSCCTTATGRRELTPATARRTRLPAGGTR